MRAVTVLFVAIAMFFSTSSAMAASCEAGGSNAHQSRAQKYMIGEAQSLLSDCGIGSLLSGAFGGLGDLMSGGGFGGGGTCSLFKEGGASAVFENAARTAAEYTYEDTIGADVKAAEREARRSIQGAIYGQ